jgi:glycosyltransferase involved in cell wall biosynthesis
MIPERIKIMFVYSSLFAGGEERLLIDRLKELDRNKFDIALCLFKKAGEFISEIPSDIPILELKKNNRWDFFPLIFRLRKTIQKQQPDIVVSGLWYPTVIVALSKLFIRHSFRFIAREPHNHKRDYNRNTIVDLIRRQLLQYGHQHADLILTGSKGAATDIAANYGIPRERIHVIYNAVNLAEINRKAAEPITQNMLNNRKYLVTLGRLIHRKGFDILLRSFKIVKMQSNPELRLVIIGEGKERANLEQLARELEISDAITFLGYQPNPYNIIRQAAGFVCSSRWEGFASVIIEAMATGVPIVSTQCPFGPDEIIIDGINGLLVPVDDTSAMANAIIRILTEPQLREQFSEAGKTRVINFDIKYIVKEYETVFTNQIKTGSCKAC